MKRFGSATWSGSLRDGKGAVSTESQAMKNHSYTFFSRYGETPGTSPEELVGAAHAACFTMSFVRMLGMAHFVPQWVDSPFGRRHRKGWGRLFHRLGPSHRHRQNTGH
jgi:osmotically inducible protein OsmC